ncbi:MAG: BamA/OMP85 family outer membrane protein [Opitutaceae bacterium]
MSFRFLYLTVVLLACCLKVQLTAQENLEIEGLGFFKNRTYEGRLAFLQGVAADEPAVLDAAFLEDSAFLLLQQLKRNGYLKPRIEAAFEIGADLESVTWESKYAIQLDADFLADRATFNLEPGILYHYDSIEVTGVSVLDEQTVDRYFIPYGALVITKSSRVFTESNFERRISRLLSTLRGMGYREAKLVLKDAVLDDKTGAVNATISIELGYLHRVGQVTVEWIDASGAVERTETESHDALLTTEWEQSKRQALRNAAYREGYADAEVLRTAGETTIGEDGISTTDIAYKVMLNSKVGFAGVRFLGDDRTKHTVLERRVDLLVGEPLDPMSASESRRELMGLGIYREIKMSFEPEEGSERKIIFDLQPAPWQELDLLAGWGSYELARIGFNWDHQNPFGRAHKYEISGKQSLRSTQLDTTYSIPQLLGTPLTAYASAEYSFREEISFDRSKESITTGVSMTLAESDIMLSLEYGYAREDADRARGSDFESEDTAKVGSLTGKLSLDRRDNFLAPTTGYTLYSELSIANELLGGTVAFQKIELGASYHTALLDSTLLHLGFQTGAIFSQSDARSDIPFTERFFNGGENSVRGYLEGEASPLDRRGQQIGAESYALLNIELEQRLLQDLSLVSFFDMVINSRDGFFADGTESLSSAGLGLRYQTVVGPIRLEYGHNLNPRPEDRNGALHFSIGFPF